MSQADERGVILDFVQGRRSWRDLEQVGLTVSFMDDGCDCDGKGTIVVAPSPHDIAVGLLRKVKEPTPALQRWACVLLAASAVLDLTRLEKTPSGERLLEAVWDASAGKPVNEASLRLAESLAED